MDPESVTFGAKKHPKSTQRAAVRQVNAELRREIRAAYVTVMSRHLKRRIAVTPRAAKPSASRIAAMGEFDAAWDRLAWIGGAR